MAAILPYLAAWIILAAVVLLRLRRTAALAAAAMLIWSVVCIADPPNWSYIGPQSMLIFLALGLELTALGASPGPRRGRQLLTWKDYALTVAVAATGSRPAVPLPLFPGELLGALGAVGVRLEVRFGALQCLAERRARERRQVEREVDHLRVRGRIPVLPAEWLKLGPL
jgi:hypothetical protein